MSSWLLHGGTLGGLAGLIAAAALVWSAQVEATDARPFWLSVVAFGGMILYGGTLVGSLLLQVTRLVSVMNPP